MAKNADDTIQRIATLWGQVYEFTGEIRPVVVGDVHRCGPGRKPAEQLKVVVWIESEAAPHVCEIWKRVLKPGAQR
jgi:hypothetical protein